MIQTENEIFTVMDTVNVGLIDAIKNGTTTPEVTVKIDKGNLIFNQRNFTFTDKNKKMYS